ncbi:MAG: type II toxin-antitoxin system mRNA interferase toxin, RelE/StbE family [Candidatus Falkowbacteria bacterium]
MQIIYSPKFVRKYKRLLDCVKDKAEKAEQLFRANPFYPALKIHKLTGKFKNFYSFSIDYKYRIIFEFEDRNTVYFHSVGDHSVYQ